MSRRSRLVCGEHLRVCGAVSCIVLGFGLVGWHRTFDSCAAWGRAVALFPIFGIYAFVMCYARQPVADMGSAGGVVSRRFRVSSASKLLCCMSIVRGASNGWKQYN